MIGTYVDPRTNKIVPQYCGGFDANGDRVSTCYSIQLNPDPTDPSFDSEAVSVDVDLQGGLPLRRASSCSAAAGNTFLIAGGVGGGNVFKDVVVLDGEAGENGGTW